MSELYFHDATHTTQPTNYPWGEDLIVSCAYPKRIAALFTKSISVIAYKIAAISYEFPKEKIVPFIITGSFVLWQS